MKRIAALLLFFLMIPLCGCSAEKQISCSLQPFVSIAAFTFENAAYEAQVIYSSPVDITLSFLKPEALQGLTYSSKSDAVLVSFCGVALQNDDLARLPLPEPVPLQLLRLLSAVGQQSLLADSDGLVTGTFGDQTYELLLDLESGAPRRIATDDIVCTFGNTVRNGA